jgi:hypothetical protein
MMNAPIPELMLIVFLLFIAIPIGIAIWDEVREYRFRNWQARQRAAMLTSHRGGRR